MPDSEFRQRRAALRASQPRPPRPPSPPRPPRKPSPPKVKPAVTYGQPGIDADSAAVARMEADLAEALGKPHPAQPAAQQDGEARLSPPPPPPPPVPRAKKQPTRGLLEKPAEPPRELIDWGDTIIDFGEVPEDPTPVDAPVTPPVPLVPPARLPQARETNFAGDGPDRPDDEFRLNSIQCDGSF
ncbi:MAG: hypothetical protein SGPRY_003309 [Prymnesium sp.]